MRPVQRIQYLLILLALTTWLTVALDGSRDTQKHQLYKRLDDDVSLHQLYKRSPQVEEISGSGRGKKYDQGTKDAPVDGRDGKPHAGPFVDSHDEHDNTLKEAMGKSSKKAKEKAQAEDGVMNDPDRTLPKKGTTGTEGGVSEKSRNTEDHESETGRKKIQKPASPKDADSVSHKEEDTILSTKKTTKTTDYEDSTDEKPKGAMSMEKPDDLPEKPHNYPLSGSPKSHDDDGTITKSRTSKSMDTADQSDSDEEEEGSHDLIRWDSLFGSFTSIAATEIGDKTFIVAALMAMRHPRFQVFTAAFAALFVMTILSGVTGHAVGAIFSKKYSALLAAVLFLVFGAKSLREGYEMDPNQGTNEEMQEVQAELEEKEVDMARANGHKRVSSLSPDVLESGRVERSRSRSRMTPLKRSPSNSPSPSRARPTVKGGVAGIKNLLGLLLSPAWVETFSMTFVGELGDRSQIATVAMAAGQEYYWIMVGASLGHLVCTAGAVLGGSALAGRISMRTVTLGGGFIFVAFGLFTLLEAATFFR